jgi:hypothetical protein
LSYNLKVDQSLRANLVFSIGYSGSHGYHNIEQWDPNTAYPVVCGAATQPFPIFGSSACPAALPNGSLYYNAGAPRRNPALGSAKMFSSTSTSLYNALTVELRKRFSQGLSFKANYTWSRAEDVDSTVGAILNCATTLVNSENPKSDWAVSCFNITNRFSLTGSYELPIGNGKALLSNSGSVVDRILGGWQVNVIVGAQSGLPFNPQLGFNQSRNGSTANADRPSRNPSFSGSPYLNKPNKWFDANAFILPLLGTYGNVARNALIGPGLATVDFSLLKNIRVSERTNLQFRAESFNLMNRANFGAPSTLVLNTDGSARSTAGKITNTTTTSRQLQFGLKLIF